ncbi:MAG TPA: ABC transporter permease [Gemmatimonadaceae bacterium]|nr:ABC transporter permease [Gemmatimonadaceae bacterium]
MRGALTRIQSALSRLSGFARRSRMEQRLAEEMQYHIDMQTERNVCAGMPPEEARRSALVAFGGRERFREDARDEYRSRRLEDLVGDVRYALRGLRRAPTFTAAVVLSLALGIGAISAIFTVVERVVLRPLPYGHDGGALVMLWSRPEKEPSARDVISYPDFVDWVHQSRTIQWAAAFNGWGPALIGHGDPQYLRGASVTADFFRALGTPPLLGRTFRADEDVPGAPRVVVIGYPLWQRLFAGDPRVLGRTLTLSGNPYTVIGVMPPGFRDPQSFHRNTSEIWRPLASSGLPRTRLSHYLRAVARLRPGVSIDAAERDLGVVATRLARAYPVNDSAKTIAVVPMQEQVVGQVRPALFAALAGAACLLLIVCGNVATLVVARYGSRSGEMAVRSAMGAGRSRLARMLFIESAVLALIGGALGVGLAAGGLDLLRHFAPPGLPRVNEIALDSRVLAVTLGLTLFACILFGLLPALRASRANLAAMLHTAARRTTARSRLRSVIIVAQFALSLLLLSATGLLTVTLVRLNAIPLGFSDSHLLTVRLSLFATARELNDSIAGYFFRVVPQRLEAIPGVEAAGLTSSLPLSGVDDMVFRIPVAASAVGNERDWSSAHVRMVTPDYRRAIGARLIAGRDFTDADSLGRQPVAILNRTAAAEFFPHRNPIGAELLVGRDLMRDTTSAGRVRVVGVVDDVRFAGPATPPAPELFFPDAQTGFGDVAILVRTTGTPGRIIPAVRDIVRSFDPTIPLGDVQPMSELVAGFTARQRFYAYLFAIFGLTALALSAVGVYGVVAYLVNSQRHEIGVRMALGAQPRHILIRFVMRVAVLVVVGATIGIFAAMEASRAIASLLYGVQPGNVPTLAAAAALLAAVALGAALVPALRATRIDPVEAFRSE